MEEKPSYKPLEYEQSNENCKAIQDSVCDNLMKIIKMKMDYHKQLLLHFGGCFNNSLLHFGKVCQKIEGMKNFSMKHPLTPSLNNVIPCYCSTF